MSNYSELRDAVSGYMHRSPEVFYFNNQDLLLRAVNNAKNFTQRALNLEEAKFFGELNDVAYTDGVDTSVLKVFGENTLKRTKLVRRVFLPTVDRVSQYPIDFVSRDAYVSRVKRRYEYVALQENAKSNADQGTFPTTATIVGRKVFVVNTGTSRGSLYFDALEWLPDFAPVPVTGVSTSTSSSQLVASAGGFVTAGVRIGDVVYNTTDGTSAVVTAVVSASVLALNADIFVTGETYRIDVTPDSQTNFLLDTCFDYMLFRSVYELNFYLKEDTRVQLSDKLLENLWNNVIRWNETLIMNSVDDSTLS